MRALPTIMPLFHTTRYWLTTKFIFYFTLTSTAHNGIASAKRAEFSGNSPCVFFCLGNCLIAILRWVTNVFSRPCTFCGSLLMGQALKIYAGGNSFFDRSGKEWKEGDALCMGIQPRHAQGRLLNVDEESALSRIVFVCDPTPAP